MAMLNNQYRYLGLSESRSQSIQIASCNRELRLFKLSTSLKHGFFGVNSPDQRLHLGLTWMMINSLG